MLHTYTYCSTTLHITYPPDVRTNRDVNQLFAVWSFVYFTRNSVDENAPHDSSPEQKMFEAEPKRHCSSPEQHHYLFRYYY